MNMFASNIYHLIQSAPDLKKLERKTQNFKGCHYFCLVASDNDRLPKNPAGLAKSKTNPSLSHSLCEEPLSWSLGATVNAGIFGLYPREAIRQEQKEVCSPFRYSVPQTKKMAPRQGEGRHPDSFKCWQPYLLP